MTLETLQEIADAYTAGEHKDQILDRFDLSEDEFGEIRRAWRLRRGVSVVCSALETDEDVEQAVDHMAGVSRRAQAEKRSRSRVRRELDADAAKWRVFEDAVRDAVQAVPAQHGIPVGKVTRSPALPPRSLVANAQDVHVGKLTVDGSDNAEAFTGAMQRLVPRSARAAGGRLDRVYLVVGADFYHVDNVQKSTTKGTPQDMSMTVPEMVVCGQRVMVETVELCRSYADTVELVYVRGNHDDVFGLWLYEWLRAYYRDTADVETQTGADAYRSRQYRLCGSTLLVFNHGEGRSANLPLTAAQEARELWGQARRTAVFTGHRHFEHTKDNTGVTVYQTPSASGSDRWHDESGWVCSRRAVQGHVVDPDEGVVFTVTATA